MAKDIARRLLGINILTALAEPALLGNALHGNPASWEAWKAFLSVFFGLKLSPPQEALYRQCTGRSHPPEGAFSTCYAICGRGAGKSFMLCLLLPCGLLIVDG